MSPNEITVGGTLDPDGTLRLDQKPNLPPGRVSVVVRPEPGMAVPSGENWFGHLQRIRAEREATGYPFMNEAEVTAHLAWLREEDPVDELLREAGRQGQGPG